MLNKKEVHFYPALNTKRIIHFNQKSFPYKKSINNLVTQTKDLQVCLSDPLKAQVPPNSLAQGVLTSLFSEKVMRLLSWGVPFHREPALA